MTKIICIGNRFAYPDNFGIVVYEELKKLKLDGVEIIEGGVGGDNLALHFEDDAKILIIDYATRDMKKISTQDDIAKLNVDEYNHANSLMYFLKLIKKEYKLYLCSDNFNEKDINIYINEILQLTKKM